MNKRIFLLLPLTTFILIGCSRGGKSTTTATTKESSSSISQTSSSGTSSITSAITTSSSSSSSSSSKTSSTSSTSSTSPTPQTISIKDAITLGNSYAKDVPIGSHEYFGEVISTKGRAIQNIAIGLNQSGLTYICDGEAMIPCLGGTGSNTLYKKCSDYIGQDTSNYIVTGKIGYYYSMPCLEITDFILKQDMKFTIDYKSFDYTNYDSIENYNDFLLTIDYNKKGYGESKLVKLTNLKCLSKADDNSWIVTDGTYSQGVYHQTSNTALSVNTQYTFYGISCLYKWKPSLRILSYEVSQGKSIEFDIDTVAITKTASEMYSCGCPKDDTEKSTSTNNFIKTFKYFYKSELYFNYYIANNNGYVVAGDNYYSSVISSQTTAQTNKMFLFNNASYNRWQSLTYVPVANYLLENIKLTSYYVEYQFTKNSGVMMPQVYMFEEYIPTI